jgi:16S rRNA (guanine527-N7)-methyltransferase
VKHPGEPRPTQDATALIESAARLPVHLEPEQAEAVLAFERLLLDRAVPLGLVSRGDAPTVRPRHILDSLRAVLALESSDVDAYDLGSGSGLPGIVVAIAMPTLRVGLVEARSRRAGFLELAVERLELPNVAVLAKPADQLEVAVDVCFARALAPLPEAWKLARHLLRPGGRLVYFAGEGFRRPDPMPPDASSFRLLQAPVLASSGPLAIMTRQ